MMMMMAPMKLETIVIMITIKKTLLQNCVMYEFQIISYLRAK